MSVEAHIQQLKERHTALESELSTLIASPSANDEELAEVKRQKLRLKDEINRLQSEAA
ncbi:MAG: YdcH family protein [Boseongicola sp.]